MPLELLFYQSLDTNYPQLKPFVPRFRGVIVLDLNPYPSTIYEVSNPDSEHTSSLLDKNDSAAPCSENTMQVHERGADKRCNESCRRRRGTAFERNTPPFLSSTYSANLWTKEMNRDRMRASSDEHRHGKHKAHYLKDILLYSIHKTFQEPNEPISSLTSAYNI